MSKSNKINEIMAEKIAIETALSYKDALHILNVSDPSIKNIAFVKLTMERLSNAGVDKRVILDACMGITTQISKK